MQSKTLFAAMIAAAFTFPLAANAGGNKDHSAKTASAETAATNGANDGGAEAMFKAMDKDGDGFISNAEAAGSPHAPQFAQLDKNGDGKLSRDEHYNAPDHVAARAKGPSGTGNTSGAKAY